MKYNLNNEFKIQLAKEYLDRLIKEGATIELRRIKARRTIDQNALYWLWLTCLEREAEIGYKKEQFHVLFRGKYLRKEDNKITKIIYPKVYYRIIELIETFQYFDELNDVIDLIAQSTTELDTNDFTCYLNVIQDFSMLNFNIRLLTLNDIHFDEFYKEYV